MSFKASREPKLKEGLQFDLAELEDIPVKEKEAVLTLLKNPQPGFDLRTHIVEPRTGMLLKYQPYRLHCVGGERFFYRKDEHGVERRYSEQGYPLDGEARAGEKPPQTETEGLLEELKKLRDENAKLQGQLIASKEAIAAPAHGKGKGGSGGSKHDSALS